MYYLKTSFDPDFSDLIMHLKAKYPKRLANIDGIGDEQTDFSQFSKDFFSTRTTTSDISVDSNANIDDMSVAIYNSEISKALLRLNSYFVIWKKMKQLYGLTKANQIIEDQFNGSIYINDMHGIGARYAILLQLLNIWRSTPRPSNDQKNQIHSTKISIFF